MKALSVIVAILLLAVMFNCFAVEVDLPSRVINVVYDDSGSMISTGGQLVDTWCQAKYSIEVFAALLGEKDTMNIYVMSDYLQSTSRGPRLVLLGGDGAEANVGRVHGMLTNADATPFNSVRKAYSDLEAVTADEKWLVVLTDGMFEDGRMSMGDVDDFFMSKASDVRVMFLSIGAIAGEITPNESYGIFFEKAQTSKDVLSKITEICTRIFNSDKLAVDVSAKNITFDVPMRELTIFAQGANVSINGIQTADGRLIKSSTSPVSVKYSERAALNYENIKVSTDLVGSIATFKDDFTAGDYKIDVSGAETIEIYYKPNVEIMAYLTGSSGNAVSVGENIEAGEYTLEFGFVKAGTTERVEQSKLLGDVTYAATVTSNGVTHDRSYSSGDKITLDEGDLAIDVTARYLKYNSVSAHLEFGIYRDKALTFSLMSNPEYPVTSDGMDTSTPIKLKALLDGKEFTDTQWSDMGIPDIEMTSIPAAAMGDFQIAKTTTPGVFNVYPSLEGDKPSTGEYGDCDYYVSYTAQHGAEKWSGDFSGTADITETRPWWECYWDLVLRWLIIALICILILGYLPPFKKYLPRKLVRSPKIDCTPMRPGVLPMTAHGKYVKRLAPTLIPYKAEVGTIKFVPAGVTNVPILKVKGAGKKCMFITNVRDFAGKSHITFNGVSVEQNITKLPKKPPGIMLAVSTPEMSYTCIPSKSK